MFVDLNVAAEGNLKIMPERLALCVAQRFSGDHLCRFLAALGGQQGREPLHGIGEQAKPPLLCHQADEFAGEIGRAHLLANLSHHGPLLSTRESGAGNHVRQLVIVAQDMTKRVELRRHGVKRAGRLREIEYRGSVATGRTG